jgi:hypothetical protein
VSRHGRGIRVSHPGLVATVAKARRGLALRHCGDVGSSVAQQGDEGSSGQRWGSGLFLSFSSRSHGRGLGRGDRGSTEESPGHCGKDMGMSEVSLHCLQT